MLFLTDLSNAQTVTIGTQVWMTKNLNVSTFRNGDPIPEAKTNEEWKQAGDNKQPAWCYYNNDPKNGGKYGKLYNCYAVNDPRGIAPVGYHVPSDAEWTKLADFLGSDAGKKMKSASGWYQSGNGTNSSGFSGLPGGRCDDDGRRFHNFGNFGNWWSSTEEGKYDAWYCSLGYYNPLFFLEYNGKFLGMSVRGIKD